MKLHSCWWIVLCLLQITLTADAQQRQSDSHLKPALSNRELAARVRTSLVLIVAQDRSGSAVAEGSGFFLTPNLVATNLHVLKRSSRGYIKAFSDGKNYEIDSVVGFDLKHDICILKLSLDVGTPLTLSTDKVAAGDDILVAGNPEGLEASFSKGIVSGVRSDSGLIQMDAAISPGSSGGPVVNKRGDVVGISVSSLAAGQNLNFAVPVQYLRDIKCNWDLDVREIGGLAVTDLEEAGLHGPVKSSIERNDFHVIDEYAVDQESYVLRHGAAPPVGAVRYTPDGQNLETTYFKEGVEVSKFLTDYSADGLIERVTSRSTNPADSFSYQYSGKQAVIQHNRNIHFDEVHVFGKKSEQNYREDTYDNGGRLVQQVFPADYDGLKIVWKYDSFGRPVEARHYRRGHLYCIYRYGYKVNQRKDWVMRRQTVWLNYPPQDVEPLDSDFHTDAISYRDTTYYDDPQ